MGLGKYLKEAFRFHWNLLALGAGTVFALLTGRPDIVLPLVAAGEVTYLGLLATHPKFQRAVDAQQAKQTRQVGAARTAEVLEKIRQSLPPESLDKYEALRKRANELRQIAMDLRPQITGGGRLPFEDLQLQSLDRLLWIFLRLLYTEFALSRFLDRTSEKAIRDDIARLEAQIARYAADESNPRRMKARQTLQDNLATSQARLDNLQKAQENHHLVQLEIDRLENKIRSLSELAVNRQEPDFISDQVDAVAESMLETEKTMNELQFATGFTDVDEEVPELLSRRMQTEGQG